MVGDGNGVVSVVKAVLVLRGGCVFEFICGVLAFIGFLVVTGVGNFGNICAINCVGTVSGVGGFTGVNDG